MIHRNLMQFFFAPTLVGVCLVAGAALPAKAEKHDEMSQYQHILESPVATVQDMVDLIMMTRGDFANHHTPTDRINEAKREGWLGDESASDELRRGTLAYAIMQNYPIDRGLLFRLTLWQRYALRDAQQAGVLSPKNSKNHKVSGEQLVGAVTAAEEYKQEKEQWKAYH